MTEDKPPTMEWAVAVVTQTIQQAGPGMYVEALVYTHLMQATVIHAERARADAAEAMIAQLQGYAIATRAIVPQLEELLPHVSDDPILVPGDTPIKDGIRVYGLFADDLDKILAGEELKPFLIEGTLG